MKNEILKKLALEAKQRLKDGGYKESKYNKKSIFGTSCQVLRVFKGGLSADYKLVAMDKSQDEALYKKVCNMLASGVVNTCPIAHLINPNEFAKLDSVGKERYVFNLSEKYKSFKKRYELEFEKAKAIL